MEVLWLEGAIADLNQIVEYAASSDPGAPPRIAAALHRAAERLGAYPQLGRKGRVTGTRELVVAGLPFVIAYRVSPQRVEVVRVIHGRRDWRTAFDERS